MDYSQENADVRALMGRNIRLMRRQQGMTIKVLSEKASLNPSYMGEVERGRRNPSLENIHKIAQGLSVAPSALLRQPPPAPVPLLSDTSRETQFVEIMKMLNAVSTDNKELFPHMVALIAAWRQK